MAALGASFETGTGGDDWMRVCFASAGGFVIIVAIGMYRWLA